MRTTAIAFRPSLRLAAWAAFAAAATAAAGVVFLIAMFASLGTGARTTGLTFGRINDLLILVSYPMAIPAVLAAHRLLRPHAPIQTSVATTISIVSIGAIAFLQALLVLEVLTFEQQVIPVTIAIACFGVGQLLAAGVGRSTGLLPGGVRWAALAALYFGFPLWAAWMGRQLIRIATGGGRR
jgi:hypothetical protein